MRVPGLVISPYARKGISTTRVLSHDAYLKFIEDDFLGGMRLNPATDGRPDPRPDVREEAAQLGDLTNDFNFNQEPQPPMLLNPHPAPGPASQPPGEGGSAPTVSAVAAPARTQTTATVEASVNPNGEPVTACNFEYGITTYESSVPCEPAQITGNSALTVSAHLEGLNAATTYHSRLVAKNAVGTASNAGSFATKAWPPTVISLNPNNGPSPGATTVAVTGTHFVTGSEKTKFMFGKMPATSVNCTSSSTCNVVIPVHPVELVNVRAIADGMFSAITPGDQFTYN